MGLLSEGTPLSWEETKKHAELVRRMGVLQFLASYHRLKDRRGDELKWGDEVGRPSMRLRAAPRLEPPEAVAQRAINLRCYSVFCNLVTRLKLKYRRKTICEADRRFLWKRFGLKDQSGGANVWSPTCSLRTGPGI